MRFMSTLQWIFKKKTQLFKIEALHKPNYLIKTQMLKASSYKIVSSDAIVQILWDFADESVKTYSIVVNI